MVEYGNLFEEVFRYRNFDLIPSFAPFYKIDTFLMKTDIYFVKTDFSFLEYKTYILILTLRSLCNF